MKTRLLDDNGSQTYALVFETGDEAIAGLTAFARQHGIAGAHFTAIGAFSDAVLAYFDWESKEYQRNPLPQQVEVLTLAGDIADKDGEPVVHAHVVVGLPDGTTRGGHLMEAHVRPTLEVILTESPVHLRRRLDPTSGIALIDLDATGSVNREGAKARRRAA